MQANNNIRSRSTRIQKYYLHHNSPCSFASDTDIEKCFRFRHCGRYFQSLSNLLSDCLIDLRKTAYACPWMRITTVQQAMHTDSRIPPLKEIVLIAYAYLLFIPFNIQCIFRVSSNSGMLMLELGFFQTRNHSSNEVFNYIQMNIHHDRLTFFRLMKVGKFTTWFSGNLARGQLGHWYKSVWGQLGLIIWTQMILFNI